MRLIVAKDYADVSRKAANIIAAQVHLKPDCVLGLATGSSPVGTYKELIAKYESGELDFSQVKTINLDEYVGLTKDHDQSYAYFMRTNLFDHVNIDQANCNSPDGTNPDAAAECARYDAVIEAFGGADLQLLGLGPNGHIGFTGQVRPAVMRCAKQRDCAPIHILPHYTSFIHIFLVIYLSFCIFTPLYISYFYNALQT